MDDKTFQLYLALYFLLGFIYVIARNTPARFEKFKEELHRMYGDYPESLVRVVVAFGFVIAFIIWPIPFFRFLKRKIKGEKDPFN